MFEFKTTTIEDKNYLLKINGEYAEAVAVNHKGKFKSSISLPKVNYSEIKDNCRAIEKSTLEQIGYVSSKYSSLQLINNELRLDTSFLLEQSSYVEDIEIAKSLVEAGVDKSKGFIIFENNGEFQKHLKSKDINFKLYNTANLKVKYADLNERILLDVFNLTGREKSVIGSFIHFKQQNKGNEDIGIPVLDGSNWLYDLFIVEPATLAQQFGVNEFSVKMLKTSMLKLNMNGMMTQEHSSINDIIYSAQNGEIVIIDVKENDKKLIKATLANNAKSSLLILDNSYHKYDNVQYLLYDTKIDSGTTKDFKSFVLNKNSFALKNELIGMQYYLDEIKFLDFEYIVIKAKAFPLIVTNENYIKNNVTKKVQIDISANSGFF